MRIGELLDAKHLRERLTAIVAWKNRLLRGLSADAKTFDAGTLTDEYLGYADKMRPFITDTTRLLIEATKPARISSSKGPRAVCSMSITALIRSSPARTARPQASGAAPGFRRATSRESSASSKRIARA